MRRTPPPSSLPTPSPGRRWGLAWAIILVAATFAVFLNGLNSPFVFDDLASIPENPTIRHLRTALSPPTAGGLTVEGRPLLNLSFALNRAIGCKGPAGYRLTNITLHAVAGLLLFVIVWRTLSLAALQNRFAGTRALHTAGFTALIWLVHPLQTESVTYIVQRGEILAGVCILAAFGAFIQGTRASGRLNRNLWLAAATLATFVGVGCKETTVVIPVLVLLYDRSLIAGSFRKALRERRWFYAVLVLSWAPLLALVLNAGGRGGSAGFDTSISTWHYLLTQCRALVLYLRQALFPDHLIFDHGMSVVKNPADVAGHAALLITLVSATIWALLRRPTVGFAAACFFVLLAPTSSFVPIATQTVAEHRMYLALAPIVCLAACGLLVLTRQRPQIAACLGLAAALALGVGTVRRNEDFRTTERIWSDTVEKVPDNPRAWLGLGTALAEAKRSLEALRCFERSLALDPMQPRVLDAKSNVMFELGRVDEGIGLLREAFAMAPRDLRIIVDLGNALVDAGHFEEGTSMYKRMLEIDPSSLEAHHDLGVALARAGRNDEALAEFEILLKEMPDDAEGRLAYANTLVLAGRTADAEREFRHAIRSDPQQLEAWSNLAYLLARMDRRREAIECYEEMLRRFPEDDEARRMLAELRALP